MWQFRPFCGLPSPQIDAKSPTLKPQKVLVLPTPPPFYDGMIMSVGINASSRPLFIPHTRILMVYRKKIQAAQYDLLRHGQLVLLILVIKTKNNINFNHTKKWETHILLTSDIKPEQISKSKPNVFFCLHIFKPAL